ncbi:hypothetical protein [Algoriphagus sp.]|uniref:hypothetical protein n=1 Tax=Algoriphagus sp. TaxID=1872435 RepID=UPI003F70B903
MNLIKSSIFLVLMSSMTLTSCTRKTAYEKIKEKEIASGKIQEDLFLGLKLGMSRKDFYDTCWELNKQGILINGAHELMVKYEAKMPSGKDAYMYFYPKFEEDNIYYMEIEFQYMDWSPTNPEYNSDNLLRDVTGYFETLYNPGFFRVENSSGVFAMVKVDGNRLVRTYVKHLQAVRVDILDLRVKDIKDLN